MAELNRILNDTLRCLALVIPVSVLMIVLRSEIVQLAFQRGRFDAAATGMTAQILIYLMPGAFALSAYMVIARGYYAAKDTWSPAVFGTIIVVCTLPLYWYGMQLLGARGIALALVISSYFQALLLFWLWNRRTGNENSGSVYAFSFKILGISVFLGIGMEWIRRLLVSVLAPGTVLTAILTALIVGAVFSLLLLAAGRLFGIPEVRALFERALSFLQQRRKTA